MLDHNVPVRHIKPVAKKLGQRLVNWPVLRRSYAPWLIASGADLKSAQAQMRHASLSPQWRSTLKLSVRHSGGW